jgi:polyisoprenoid-binding protein YceI
VRWWQWIAAIALAGVLALGVASVWFILAQPSPAPLALPRARAAAPAGPLNGTWSIAAGSVAGFRVRASALGIGTDVVGRTGGVTGTIAIARDWVVGAKLTIALTGLEVAGKSQPQLAVSLRTQRYPTATFSLTRVTTLGRAFASGGVVTRRAYGFLSMDGNSCAVTVTLSARRDGPALQVAGSIPVDLGYWGIQDPAGAGILGSLADSGVAEFRLVLNRAEA